MRNQRVETDGGTGPTLFRLTIGHQQPGLRVLDHVAHAVGRVVYVNRHVVFAGSQHAEQEHGDVATFLHHDADRERPAVDAQQCMRDALRLRPQLTVAVLMPFAADGEAVRLGMCQPANLHQQRVT